MSIHVRKSAEGETVERTGNPIFTGVVWGRGLIPEGASQHLNAMVVSFAAGARTKMHTHTSDQMLYVVAGTGKVGDAQGEQVITTGDTVLIPAGESHWHGAGDTGAPMSHITVMRADSETTVDE